MPELVLPRGHVLLFDEVDAGLIAEHCWHAIPARDTFYAQSGYDTNVTAHRLILDPPAHLLVDHVNRNGLDNRRANLRLANQSQNKANRPAPRNNTSGYKGVSRSASGRWAAQITVDYRKRALGTFDTAELAAAAYDAAALEAWGQFALLNLTTDPAPDTPSPVPGAAAASSTADAVTGGPIHNTN